MSFSETISPFLGRCAFVWFYASTATRLVRGWHGTAGLLDARHVPLAPLVILVALVLTGIGCLSLLLGWHTRHGAVLLFGLTIVAAVLLHDYWHVGDAARRAAQFALFARDVAICGGLLVMVGMGSGPFGIDNRLER